MPATDRGVPPHHQDFTWAVIGPGRIAHRFAEAVQALPGTRLLAVHGRDAERAAAFAQRWSQPGQPAVRVEPDLGALLAGPAIDAFYVATPHASHFSAAHRCLEAGKPVLCEKPLVPNLAQARELVALSRQRRVLLMEALWTRLLPIYGVVRGWLDAGAIGAVRSLQSSFSYAAPYDPTSRLFNPALAGGALLDIGIYNLAMTRWVLETRPGNCPEPTDLHATGMLAPSGVDQRVTGRLSFPGGVVSQFACGFDGDADNALHIAGERGSITLPRRFWEATEAMLQRPGEAAQTVHAPFRINGFEEEIEEFMRCARGGLLESRRIPHAETLALVGWMDRIRREIGVRYPFD
jgi:predicted dehydrogenase